MSVFLVLLKRRNCGTACSTKGLVSTIDIRGQGAYLQVYYAINDSYPRSTFDEGNVGCSGR